MEMRLMFLTFRSVPTKIFRVLIIAVIVSTISYLSFVDRNIALRNGNLHLSSEGKTFGNIIGLNTSIDEKESRVRTFLPSNLYPQELVPHVQQAKNFGKFDPRLLPALYIDIINDALLSSGELFDDFKLPFNWNMLLDFTTKLMETSLVDKFVKTEASCESFRSEIGYKDKDNFACKEYTKNSKDNIYNLNFELYANCLTYFKSDALRKIYAYIHGLTSFQIPDKIVFLGIVGGGNGSLVLPTYKIEDNKQNLKVNKNIDDSKSLAIDKLSLEFLNRKLKKNINQKYQLLFDGISVYKTVKEFNNIILDFSINEKFLMSNAKTKQDLHKLHAPDSELFLWNSKEELNKIKKEMELDKNNISVLKKLSISLETSLLPNFREKKYFGEAYISSRKVESGHFDWRFFDLFTQDSAPLHQATIHRMARSWFKLCQDSDVPTWLNHGSLIGWYWNGYNLPYDNDIDVQLPIQSLYKLAKNLNNSLIFDVTNVKDYVNDDLKIDNMAEMGFRSYYLDINPGFVTRDKLQNKHNLIDARFIDVRTGLYIDITALADFNYHTNKDIDLAYKIMDKFDKADSSRFMQNLNYDLFYNGLKEKTDLVGKSKKQSKENKKAKADEEFQKIKENFLVTANESPEMATAIFQNLVHCRNYHFYNISELLPLIPIYFENTLSYIPSNWLRNLIIEYDSSVLTTESFRRYRFFRELNIWVNKDRCQYNFEQSDAENAQTCLEKDVVARKEFNRVKEYVRSNNKLLEKILPFPSLNDIKDIKYTLSAQYFQEDIMNSILNEFDECLLKPEPWITRNLFLSDI
ncbi:hypothetical protein PACTADRAFT_82882 [Pachysolen tannophilus NRRL Y-2460]|uniref:LicD/FKTN/FKRP nucleotidyltransferase domain-containing protein n=1 Tax=Pachysolen tannophilus NRRL Y-2460 TaxID=669874 RepID=A0A1E4TMY5_PACTA|nr:hypothetical protein PACTADRAFT_82882 [Pachysolen tannophilus NRRL Y-2460]